MMKTAPSKANAQVVFRLGVGPVVVGNAPVVVAPAAPVVVAPALYVAMSMRPSSIVSMLGLAATMRDGMATA